MKKFLSALIISSLFFSLQISSAFAARNTEAPHILPSDIDLYLEINPQAENPFSKPLQEMLETHKKEESIFTEPKDIITKTILNSEQTIITVKYNNENTNPETYVLIKSTKDNYNKFIKDLRKANEEIDEYKKNLYNQELIEEPAETDTVNQIEISSETIEIDKTPTSEEFKGHIIEFIAGDSITFYKNKYILIGESPSYIKKLINWDQTNSLSNTSEFQDIERTFQSDSFLNIFINKKFYEGILMLISIINSKSDIFHYSNLIQSSGISISQNKNYFTINSKVQLDKTTQDKLNFHPNKYNFIPRLSKKFSKKDLIFFIEKYNIQQEITEKLNLITSLTKTFAPEKYTNSIEEKTKEILNANLSEIKEITKEHMAVAIYDNQTKIPEITFAFNISEHDKVAKKIAKALINWVKTNAPTEITEKETLVGGKKIPTLIFEGPYDKKEIHLTIGTTENNLIISTDKNIKSHYGNRGIPRNKSASQNINSIVYINPQNAKNLAKEFFIKEKRLPEEKAKEAAAIALAPFGEITFNTTAQEDWLKTETTIQIDIDKFKQYKRLDEIIISSAINSMEELTQEPTIDNCDMEKLSLNTEEETAITSLQEDKIMKGYPDGCLHPNREVNRAEFVTLITRAFELPSNIEKLINFSDVPASAWFAKPIQTAQTSGIIKGDPDGNFRPADTITFAEAITVINRANKNIETSKEDLPFENISKEAWYYNEFKKALNAGIISANDSINPALPIKRKDAAVLIYKSLF